MSNNGSRRYSIHPFCSLQKKGWLRIHTHMQKRLLNRFKNYSEKKEGIIRDTILHYSEKEQLDNLWSKRKGDEHKPTQKMFQFLIGEEAAMHFIPPVVVDPSKLRTDNKRFLIDSDTPKPWMFSECVICNSKDVGLRDVSSCKRIIEKDHFVCPFHFLFLGLSEIVIVRQTSFADLYLKQYETFSEKEKEISTF